MIDKLPLGDNILPAEYVSPPKNVAADALPALIRAMLKKNRAFSERFKAQEAARQAYFDAHRFQLFIDACGDERLLDVALAFGEYDGVSEGSFVPPGIIEVMRSAGAKNSLLSLATCLIEDKRVHKLEHWGRHGLRLCLAHWSSSHRGTASCAAWKHNAKDAVAFVREFAARMNYCYPGETVAIHGLIDTDFDSVTVFGPKGELDTMSFASLPDEREEDLTGAIRARLAAIFPASWAPLAALKSEESVRAFYSELAEYLVHNADYVRRNVREGRKIQLFEHAGRIICVGRHFEFLTEHNSAFLIDDHDAELTAGLAIGFKYVGRNTIAAANGKDDWVIPVHLNIPHSGHDFVITGEYAIELRRRVVETFMKKRRQDALTAFWLTDEHGVPERLRPGLKKQLEGGLEKRLAVSVSISNRTNRQFILNW
jgi:hypothetical protein